MRSGFTTLSMRPTTRSDLLRAGGEAGQALPHELRETVRKIGEQRLRPLGLQRGAHELDRLDRFADGDAGDPGERREHQEHQPGEEEARG